MFSFLSLLLFFLHFGLLAGGVYWVCRRLQLPRQDWPFIIFLLVWIALVLTGHVASQFKALGNLAFYQCASVLVMGALLAGIYALRKDVRAPLLAAPQLEFSVVNHTKARKFLWIFLLATLAYVTVVSLLLGHLVYPDNADSMI
ncbi:MAG: hypothetical protein EBV03_11570, partial [Proteobacteria bacterium]|nr:hypothetical protein [Pseudomonadota bacterium]